MRLRRLDLTRYGKFTDRSIDFGPSAPDTPDLHIIYGLNEAGKSTTFSAYLDLLFGIADRSPYNFLHPYNTMQIGARLEFDGGEHDLVRLKQRTGSLVDGHGQPVNEALLAGALGGISRDAYRTMFSLDDQSLKDGGNAIIQSRGELGELLFQASSGLAGLSRSLAGAGDDATAIYRKRSSGTRLAELKRTLTALKAERDAIDTFASAYQALTASHAQAEAAYNSATAELAGLSTRHGELTRILTVLPLAGELARLSSELSTGGELPKPPSEWFALLPQLSRDESRLQALLESADSGIARLEAEIASIETDDGLLSVSARIAGLDAGRARYSTAEDDLPKRRTAFIEQNAMVMDILAHLEQPGHAQPETLLLPASLTGTIRDLIETRSGVDAELAAATRELARSEESLDRLRREGRTLVEADEAVSQNVLARVEKALAGLSGTDLRSRLAVEERALVQQRRACDTQFGQLAPWTGDAETLRAMKAAEIRQIEAWRAEAVSIGRRIGDHGARLRDLVTEQRLAQARITAAQTGSPIDDGEARQVRRERDAAWETHLGRLDIDSARTFEEHLHRDDALSSERLSRAHELADLRQLTTALSTNAAAIERQRELLAEAEAEGTALAARLAALLPAEMDAEKELADLLAQLESWTGKRNKSLTEWDLLQQAESRVAEIRAELDARASELTAVLQDAGMDIASLSLSETMQAASDLLANGRQQDAARTSHAKSLANVERDLAERRRDADSAESAAEGWQQAWQSALEKTWFVDKAGSVPAVREILKVLNSLPSMLREREQMAQRIATMERDQAQFRSDITAVLDDLGEALDGDDTLAAADALFKRHNAARRSQQIRQDRLEELEKQTRDRRVLHEQMAIHNASKAELTAYFGADTLAAVSLSLEQVKERERLERRVSELRNQIAAGLGSVTHADAEALLSAIDRDELERQAVELSARIEALTERSRQLFADMTRARDKLDAVGGDDAVARIEAQRRTIFLEIEDLAVRYLKLRAGTAAAEQALHLYREKHRSSMMVRASEAFRLITGGNYSGLAARPDKDREILIGVARDGSSKLADSMSTGTQFQLYLALRLAGYEEFATVRPAVPFVADDIMESFDNPRSEEVFRLLGEMSRVGQVIYLTHHWHLCEIARSVVPGVRVHEIN